MRRLSQAMVEGAPRLRANGIKVAARIFSYPSYYKDGPGTQYAPLFVGALIKSLADEGNRAAAITLLADIRDPRVAPAVEPYVRDRNPRIRSLAVRALETNKTTVTVRRPSSEGAP